MRLHSTERNEDKTLNIRLNSYVLVATAGTFFLGMWHGVRVGSFRKNAQIPYPKVLAESADLNAASPEQKKAMYLFNCAQRAHGNCKRRQREIHF